MPAKEILIPLAQSQTLSRVGLYALGVGAYAAIAVLKEHSRYAEFASLPSQFHAAMSLVLGLLLVFRTNTAYNRWWEARTLWGALVNACRNFSIKVADLVDIPQPTRDQLKNTIVQFPVALKEHLRSGGALRDLTGFEDKVAQVNHVPAFLAATLYQQIGRLKRENLIDGFEMLAIDRELLRLMDICGGCERIYKTRIAKSYRIFARQCVFLFLASLPWGIAKDFGWWTIPLTIVSAYFMLGLETVAEHIEEPFGFDEDDLDLDGLCNTIEKTSNEIFATVEHR